MASPPHAPGPAPELPPAEAPTARRGAASRAFDRARKWIPQPLRRRFTRLVAVGGFPVALAVVALAQLWPGLSEGLAPPISWDHGAHLGKAMMTAELLPALRGWVDGVEAGVPLNTLYSLGAPLWVLLFRLPTFFFLEWHQTYALAIAGFRILLGLSIYRLARAAGATRVAAFFGGLLALTDHGDHSEGGWFYDIEYGVWPMSLSMSFLWLGLADILDQKPVPNSFDEQTPRQVGKVGRPIRAAAAFGAALITHQMALLALMALFPIWCVTRWLDASSTLGRDIRAMAGATVLGLALSAFWLLPMVAQSGWLSQHAQLYRSFTELGRGVSNGEMILRAGPWTAVLAALGMIYGLLRGGRPRFLAVFALSMTLVSAQTWLTEWDLLQLVPALGKLMYPRFIMLAKPMELILGGMVVWQVLILPLTHLREQLQTRRGWLALALVVVLVAPFSKGIATAAWDRATHRNVDTTATSQRFTDFLDYARWARALPHDDGFFRIAYEDSTTHLFQAAAAYTGRPAHKIGALIAETFGNTSPSGELDVLRELNVRYVVTAGAAPSTVRGHGHEVARFGAIRVTELDGLLPLVDSDPQSETSTRPRILGLSDASVVVAPRGAERLLLRRALGPGWHAEADGKSLPIQPSPVRGTRHLRFMKVDVPAGTERVTFRYLAWRAPDVVGVGLTLAGVLVIGLFLFLPSRARLWRRRFQRGWRPVRERWRALRPPWLTGRAVLAVGLLLCAAALLAAWVSRPSFSLISSLEEGRYFVEPARVSAAEEASAVECAEAHPDGGFQCAAASWLYAAPLVQPVDGMLRRCVWAHPPPPGQRSRLVFDAATLGNTLWVGGGVSDLAGGEEGAPVVVEVKVDGVRVGGLEAPWRSEWVQKEWPVAAGLHELTFEISAQDDGRRFFCFDAKSW